jgi:hypothetical protein
MISRRRLLSVPTAALLTAVIAAPIALAAGATTTYNAIPSPLPPNLPSLGFEATSTAEFGDDVLLAAGPRRLGTVTVTMSDWALAATYPSLPASGWSHPITVNLYNVDHSGIVPAVGSLIATKTQTFAIPWRPAADPTCSDPVAWRAGDGNCYHGLAFNITFDLTSLNVSLPNEVIYGIAYNTADYGALPIHAAGPYNSLNVGVAEGAPTAGTDVDLDDVFINSTWAGLYTDGGASGVGIFRQDTGWTGSVPAASIATYWPVAQKPADCKGSSWQALSRLDGSTFKNQGDCVSYATNGK